MLHKEVINMGIGSRIKELREAKNRININNLLT